MIVMRVMYVASKDREIFGKKHCINRKKREIGIFPMLIQTYSSFRGSCCYQNYSNYDDNQNKRGGLVEGMFKSRGFQTGISLKQMLRETLMSGVQMFENITGLFCYIEFSCSNIS